VGDTLAALVIGSLTGAGAFLGIVVVDVLRRARDVEGELARQQWEHRLRTSIPVEHFRAGYFEVPLGGWSPPREDA